MKSIEEIADKYIREQYIDYGDLNGQAEIQIRDAFISGLTQGQKLPIHNVVGQSEQLLAFANHVYNDMLRSDRISTPEQVVEDFLSK